MRSQGPKAALGVKIGQGDRFSFMEGGQPGMCPVTLAETCVQSLLLGSGMRATIEVIGDSKATTAALRSSTGRSCSASWSQNARGSSVPRTLASLTSEQPQASSEGAPSAPSRLSASSLPSSCWPSLSHQPKRLDGLIALVSQWQETAEMTAAVVMKIEPILTCE